MGARRMSDRGVDRAKRVEMGQARERDTATPVGDVRSRSGGPSFEWSSYLDLLDKARRDLARLRTEGVDPDGMFNFLATAHHIYDWVINDPRATVDLKDEAKQLVYQVPPGPVGVMRLLCISAKHMVSALRPPAHQGPTLRMGDGALGRDALGRRDRLRGGDRRRHEERADRRPGSPL
jgi:hypothetical protein